MSDEWKKPVDAVLAGDISKARWISMEPWLVY